MKKTALCWNVLAAMALSGCALLSKSPPIVPRYFEPDLDAAASSQATPTPSADKRLRLGRVEAGPQLRERMAYRTSEEEVGYYNDRRWTERPDSYLRRALSHSLFEQHGLVRVVSGAAATLDAELVAFEEVKGDKHGVRVRVVMSIEDPTLGALEHTITVERDVEGDSKDDPRPVVRALSRALADAVAQITDKVLERLAQLPPAPSPPTPPAGTTSTTLTTTSSAPPAK